MHVLALVALLDTKCDIADVRIANQELKLQVANTRDEREAGLMHVDSVAPYAGMIFAYARPDHIYFWMKNTHLPLDILFFDAWGQMTGTHTNAKPFDLTPIDGGTGVQYVIELLAGEHRGLAETAQQQVELLSCHSKQ